MIDSTETRGGSRRKGASASLSARKIGLLQVDGKYPNLALMKLATWHRGQGDEVVVNPGPMDGCDLIYASKVFDFTPDAEFRYFDCEVVKGGPGHGPPYPQLPDNVEACPPDYDAFPCVENGISYAMGFTSRGCIRKCGFCLVPKMEGKWRAVGDLYSFWHGQSHVRLLDNNLTAERWHFVNICNQVIAEGVYVDFSQGLDVRVITADLARVLARVKLWGRIHFAFDHAREENAVRRGIEVLTANGVARYKLMFYVLIGYDSTPGEDLYRVELLRSLGVDPFVMPFDKADRYQRAFARWVNAKPAFRSCSWDAYRFGDWRGAKGEATP